MDQADIPALLSRMASDEDASRKMAVFKLQSSINDPSFADVFISSGGLVVLQREMRELREEVAALRRELAESRAAGTGAPETGGEPRKAEDGDD